MHKLGDLHSAGELSDREVIAGIVELTAAQSRAAAQKYVLLDEFARRALNLQTGHSNPAHFIATGTRVALGNASRQFEIATWLTEWPSITEALANGDIHDAHVKEIYDGYRTICTSDACLSREQLAAAVADLLSTAFDHTAHQVKQRAQELAHAAAEDVRVRYEQKRREREERERKQRDEREARAREAEQHGRPLPDEPEPEPHPDDQFLNSPPPQPVSENTDLNKFDMFPLANGRTRITGDVDKILAEKLRSSLSRLSKPRPSPDGTRDPRSTSKRQADALSMLLDQRSRGASPGPGIGPSTVNATVNLRDLLGNGARPASATTSTDDPEWPFRLEWTGPISFSLARLLACDADYNPIIVDDNGVPLAMGMKVRLATPAQRVAVTVRDKCCIRCGLPAEWCQVHHIVFYTDGGPTDIGNLVLLCGECHRLVHNHGWDIDFGDDGHPRVIPPAAIDPERKPIPSFHRQRRPAA